MKNIRLYSGITILVVVVFAWVKFALLADGTSSQSLTIMDEIRAIPTTQKQAAKIQYPSSAFKSQVKSFKGTLVDGRLEVDADGNLIITKSLKDLFDYFLSSYGENSISSIINSIQQHILQQLEEPARTQALQVLKAYFSYKNALLDLEKETAYTNTEILESKELGQFRQRLAVIRDMRRDYFSDAVAQAFFSDSEQYDLYTLQRMEINRNQWLSPAEKSVLLEENEQVLPDNVLDLKERSGKHLSLKAKELALENPSSEEIYNMRVKEVDSAAAIRLAQLDSQRALWQKRIQTYTIEKNIIEQSGLSTEDQRKALQQILEERFNENEIKRLNVLERISQSH